MFVGAVREPPLRITYRTNTCRGTARRAPTITSHAKSLGQVPAPAPCGWPGCPAPRNHIRFDSKTLLFHFYLNFASWLPPAVAPLPAHGSTLSNEA